jgi:7-carboxy-7-deazaguanine synthase
VSDEIRYPVAEIFDAPQGEGVHAGVAMTFVRLAGCNVGKPFHTIFEVLPVWTEQCHDWNGSGFLCDTNYKATEKLTADEILSRVTREHICLTGGEPLMHKVRPFMEAAWKQKKWIHIETSGTKDIIPILPKYNEGRLWLCISPKQGYLRENLPFADEVKVLIGADFDEDQFLKHFEDLIPQRKVSISPVNDIAEFDRLNAEKCLALQGKYPRLRISIQAHKVLGSR